MRHLPNLFNSRQRKINNDIFYFSAGNNEGLSKKQRSFKRSCQPWYLIQNAINVKSLFWHLELVQLHLVFSSSKVESKIFDSWIKNQNLFLHTLIRNSNLSISIAFSLLHFLFMNCFWMWLIRGSFIFCFFCSPISHCFMWNIASMESILRPRR